MGLSNADGAVPAAESAERARAYYRAYELVVDVQTPAPGATDEIHELLEEARRRGWPEVVQGALFADAAATLEAPPTEHLAAVQRLLTQAEQDGAPAMVALALALRSKVSGSVDSNLAIAADQDLARATVILETVPDGPLLERISAHISCAEAYSHRWLWELCDEQYAAAMKLTPDPPTHWVRCVLPAIVYNRVEMQVDWACVLRQLGDKTGVLERRLTCKTPMAAASTVDMPPQWLVELEALEILMWAIAGSDTADAARALLEKVSPENHPGAWPRGWLYLAVALSDQAAGRVASAKEAIERAVAEIDPRGSADAYDLALYVAAELDAGGERTPPMRYAHRQLSLRWTHRLAVLGSMLGRVQAERLRREHDVVIQQAHLDDLTALLNRRGFARYLESVTRRDVDVISLLVADLDDFKLVNDRYGHQVGDAVLVTVSRLLQTHVRPVDCAVRLGGDEFAIVLASAGLDAARRRAEALTHAVRSQPWDELAPGLAITVSVGLAEGTPAAFAELIERADRALYEAKRSGRGTVVCHIDETNASSGIP